MNSRTVHPITARALLGPVAAAAIPATAIAAWAGTHGRPGPAPPIPIFVEPGLLVAHLVLAVPLAWTIAARLQARPTGVPGWTWAATGIAAIAAALASGPAIMASLGGAGFLALGLARSAAATALALPWLLPAAGRPGGRDGRPGRLPGTEALATVLLATLPPLALAHRVAQSRTSEFASHRDTGRLARAWAALESLRGLGVGEVSAGEPVARARLALAGDLRQMSRAARATPGAGAPAGERLGHAFALIGLDRLDEAEAELRPMAPNLPDASLLLASVGRDRGRWDDAERDYLRVLGSQVAAAPLDPAALDRCATAYDGLADARLGAGRPDGAGLALREAIGRLPARAGHFTLRLGRLELDAGRPRAALALLGEARRLDPSLAPRVEPLLRAIRVRTPACLVPH